MAPSFVTIDNTADFDFIPLPNPPKQPTSSSTRTLLLAPPSLASHESQLRAVLALHDRSITDLHMLDRLSANLVPLPPSTYSLILLLTDASGTRTESASLLTRDVYAKLVRALRPGGKLQAQDDAFAQPNTAEYTEAILAGLVPAADGMVKPDHSASEAVPLRFGRKKKPAAESDAVPAPAPATAPSAPSGVGFVDFSDDFGEPIVTGEEDEDDDDLIDEDTLLTDADLQRMAVVPPECVPRIGKRRRACKDCTCGLAERIAAEDAAKRSNADKELKALKLDAADLAEVDFTVQGKVGSCGNCSLGDAFRCDGCPYIGMPAFEPGAEVRLLNNEVQL